MTMEPTPEQLTEWLATAMEDNDFGPFRSHPGPMARDVARLAYAAGADAELEACVDWMIEEKYPIVGGELKSARRPKPPSIKQQALHDLRRIACHAAIPDMDTFLLIHRIEDAINTIPDTTEQ